MIGAIAGADVAVLTHAHARCRARARRSRLRSDPGLPTAHPLTIRVFLCRGARIRSYPDCRLWRSVSAWKPAGHVAMHGSMDASHQPVSPTKERQLRSQRPHCQREGHH